MLISLLAQVLSAWFAFLLPSFYTFKALSHGTTGSTDTVRWSKYWTVVGALVAAEYVLEWLISWFPFYWEVKTIFLLYLSLPQTEGSTYIYDTCLQPFFSKNEAQLDAGIINVQRSVLSSVTDRLSRLVELIGVALNKNAAPGTPGAPGQLPISLDTVKSMWQMYGAPFVQGQRKDAQPTASSTAVQPTPDANVAQRTQPPTPATPPQVPEVN